MIHRLGGTDRPHVSGVAGDVCQRGRGATGFGPFGLTMQGACGITGATMRFATLAPPNVGIGAVQTTRKVCLLLTVAFVCIVLAVSTSR